MLLKELLLFHHASGERATLFYANLRKIIQSATPLEQTPIDKKSEVLLPALDRLLWDSPLYLD